MTLKSQFYVDYVFKRSLGICQKSQDLEVPILKIDINTVDTPDKALRRDILLGTISSWPFYLVSVPKYTRNTPYFLHFFENEAMFENIIDRNEDINETEEEEVRDEGDIHLWLLSTNEKVKLMKKIIFKPLSINNIPIISLETIWDTIKYTLTQVLLRRHICVTDEMESMCGGWIEVRRVQLYSQNNIMDMKSMAVPAGEGNIYNHACFSYLKYGIIPVLTNTRVIFFPYYHMNDYDNQTSYDNKFWPPSSSFELEIWSNTSSKELLPIVFELDLYIEKLLADTNQCSPDALVLNHFHAEFMTPYKRKINNSSLLDFEGVTVIAGGLGKTILIVVQLRIIPWKRTAVPFNVKIWSLKAHVRIPIKVIQAGFSFMLGKKPEAHNCHEYCINDKYKLMESYQNDGLGYSTSLKELHCEELGISLLNTGWS
ncbi:hypothetical protein T552_03269 [Pneumocystis carinii B80]|uniref:Uncharacterized protein n=1 Tax=Pneumocystis carinii (strain B80) TaxID=1408658 RepID=A0A0W4ZC89_PNEC8|nr:hypothetical protein T552_03269 [Pneumocystis carinii B80]KTW25997.1 hypothetical protein T552_03269 [Pneumocystis carinii B80]